MNADFVIIVSEALQWAWDEESPPRPNDITGWPDAIVYTKGPRLRATFSGSRFSERVAYALELAGVVK